MRNGNEQLAKRHYEFEKDLEWITGNRQNMNGQWGISKGNRHWTVKAPKFHILKIHRTFNFQ
jgi:hypothetical protein